MTHAFFKALLFLGAGSVIHACSGEQDIRKMGGLWTKIPFTYIMMWIGSLALAGIYPFAGYYSKDVILEAAYASNSEYGMFAYWAGIIAAFCTAFYSWRLIILVFHGKFRSSAEAYAKVHESPLFMTIPLLLLAGGACLSGFIGSDMLHMVTEGSNFWHGVLADKPQLLHDLHHLPVHIKLMPSYVAIVAIAFAYIFYMFWPRLPVLMACLFKGSYSVLFNKYYIDELYNFFCVRTTKALAKLLWKVFDIRIIDNCGPGGAAFITKYAASCFSRMQTGYVYHYALVMLLFMVGFISWFVWTGIMI
jgi:NADH-quinone oxidoreductase subunit L